MPDYIVKKGDTLALLAKRFKTTVDALAQQNNIKNVNSIFIGQKISYNQENTEEWIDTDGNNKVSYGDFVGCGKFSVFLNKVEKYIGEIWTKDLAREIKTLYSQYVNNPKQAVLQGVSINGLTENSYEPNPNYYRNDLDSDLAKLTIGDNNPNTKIELSLHMGKELDLRDRKVSDFLKKLLGDNLDNTSQILKKDGMFKVSTQRLENTELYKYFKEINSKAFTTVKNGKYTDDVFVENFSGQIQVPSVEINSNGVKYYTLHTESGSILYFNEKGEKVSSLDEIQAIVREDKKPDIIQEKINSYEESSNISEFVQREGYDNSKLNIGSLYINGKVADTISFNSNYYANAIDKNIAELTMNSDGISKLELQLKVGENLKSKWDKSPKDILKKFLGDNFENTTVFDENGLIKNNLENTVLYKTFLRLNPSLETIQNGSETTIQLPSMKIAPNGERYFIILDEQNKPLYFDTKGNTVKLSE